MDGNTIYTPSRTASPFYASILRLLRAQAGFAIENSIVAGMDEMRRLSCPGLVDIGLELLYRAGWTISAKPSCLQDDLFLTASRAQGAESAGLAHNMLRWGARPSANLGLLLDLALAVLKLKSLLRRRLGCWVRRVGLWVLLVVSLSASWSQRSHPLGLLAVAVTVIREEFNL